MVANKEMKKRNNTRKKKRSRRLEPSKSYLKFERVIKRSLNLISLQKPVEKIISAGTSKESVDSHDLLRAAIVLGVAAMDAYFTSIFAERLIPFLKKKGPTQRLITLLDKGGLDVEVSLELLSMERPYRRIRRLIEEYLEQHVTQKTEVIDELFLAYGLKDFSQNIQKLKGRNRLIRSIELIVKRRHQIVHDGDMNSYGQLNQINAKDVGKKIKLIVMYVAGGDEILQKQFK